VCSLSWLHDDDVVIGIVNEEIYSSDTSYEITGVSGKEDV
jgi:hypothetical protein